MLAKKLKFAKKFKCGRQQLQNLALFPSCTWFTIRSRGVRAPSAKSRYYATREGRCSAYVSKKGLASEI